MSEFAGDKQNEAYYSKEKQNEYGVIGIEVDFERFIEK